MSVTRKASISERIKESLLKQAQENFALKLAIIESAAECVADHYDEVIRHQRIQPEDKS